MEIRKPYLIIAGFGAVGLFMLGWSLSNTHLTGEKSPTPNYNRHVCDDAWQQDRDRIYNHKDEHIEYFDVVLKAGCFSGYVRVPNSWRSWDIDFYGDDAPDDWVALWFYGWIDPRGPFNRTNMVSFLNPPAISITDPHAKWRLQGKGTLRYFRTSGDGSPDEPVSKKEPENGAVKSSADAKPRVPDASPKDAFGFVVAVKGCTLDADFLLCTFGVENNGQDREFGIKVGREAATRVIDAAGEEHRGVTAKLASNECDQREQRDENGKKKRRLSATCDVYGRLSPKVPFAATVGFEMVPGNMEKVNLLELAVTDRDGGKSTVVSFGGIPIGK